MRKADLVFVGCLLAITSPAQPASFVNFETPPVHPVAMDPDGRTLAVCNLSDYRVELFDVTSGSPRPIGNIPVGIDPVSVRWRTTNELWVANHMSRTVSIVDVARRLVLHTLPTLDGPSDIAFAGSPRRAFVSCAKENAVQVIEPLTRQVVTNLIIDGERPKAMALSPDGTKLYVAIFESGNASTILVGTGTNTTSVLKHPDGPYGGQFPVPNDGNLLRPPLNPDVYQYSDRLPDSLIVKKDAAGRWMDDNHGDWTEFVSGTNAALSGRITGWDLPDRDLAVIDTSDLSVSYATGLMNLCMDLAVNPASGRIAVIGTDGANERRFEPNLKGTFLRVNLALVDPVTGTKTIRDLNPHLDYSNASVPRSVRDSSLGDPRAILWNATGTRGYIAGMGSRNLVIIDATGQRVVSAPVELGEGPCGLALDEPRQKLYVLNRFSASVSVLDTDNMSVVTNVAFFDPTPTVIKIGRRHLYDTRQNSGLGHVSCASCHPDARFDRLAWDLGNPAADAAFRPEDGSFFHPMKGPLVTQTLQDIIEPEPSPTELRPFPLHWRGDRPNIESFNVTFTDLLGRESQLTTNEMEEFKGMLATVHFPPSRYRDEENAMPNSLPLPGFFGVDSNGIPDRTPLPNGNANAGLLRFFNDQQNGRFPLTMGTCTTCHNRQSGLGFEGDIELVGRDGDRAFKPVQLRSIADKLGMDRFSTNSRAGFGFRFDGRADTLTTLLADVFGATNNQSIADLTAFLLAFPGSGIYLDGQGFVVRNDSLDAHGAIGRQFTLRDADIDPRLPYILASAASEDTTAYDVVAHGVVEGLPRGWVYVRGQFLSDRNHERTTLEGLLALAAPNTPITLMIVPAGSGTRLAVDRDGDGLFDRTELDSGFDPTNPTSHPPVPPVLSIVDEPALNRITLQWPNTGAFTLQSTSELGSSPSWSAVSGTPVLIGDEWTLTLARPDRATFFRLKYP